MALPKRQNAKRGIFIKNYAIKDGKYLAEFFLRKCGIFKILITYFGLIAYTILTSNISICGM